MSTLFSLVALDNADPERRPGSRLHQLEVYNWGTFDKKVWHLPLSGRNALLTGDIGSGKSTLVDAITTLLLPSNRVSYNKAAGAKAKERDLRSYVEGHYKSESIEESGRSRPVGLRGSQDFSVVLGVFRNTDYDTTATLAQVFRTRGDEGGQPERFYVVAEGSLTIAEHFAEFGDDLSGLRRKLRSLGANIHESFPPYGTEFRRLLGIESAQAMELFHQTVSMKAVDNLNDFVRTHMLEPFDTQARIKSLIGHFDDLTRAHAAVTRARRQIDMLTPLVGALDEHDALAAESEQVSHHLVALPLVVGRRKKGLLADRLDELSRAKQHLDDQILDIDQALKDLHQEIDRLNLEIAGHGGDRIANLETSIDQLVVKRDRQRSRSGLFDQVVAAIGAEPISDRSGFDRVHALTADRRSTLEAERSELTNTSRELDVQRHSLVGESQEVNDELRSLKERKSNIPRRSLDLRARLCAELAVDETTLPFVGELLQIHPDETDWEGAAERVLHSFALSLLVPDDAYRRVAAWIDANHLGARVVYYHVGTSIRSAPTLDRATGVAYLSDKLEIKNDSSFRPWLVSELGRRADHACVASSSDFPTVRKAVTIAGQVKDRQRHEKDDRSNIGDRRTYVLGWSNEAKIEALVEQAVGLQADLDRNSHSSREVSERLKGVEAKLSAFGRMEDYTVWDDLDWRASETDIAAQQTELAEIKAASNVLASLTTHRDNRRADLSATERSQAALLSKRGANESDHQAVSDELERVERRLVEAASTHAEATQIEIDLDSLGTKANRVDLNSLATIDDAERAIHGQLISKLDTTRSKQSGARARCERAMNSFRNEYPQETLELDAAIAAGPEYRALFVRVSNDDLPRFEADFKESLNKNTIREIAQFAAQLNKQGVKIKDRVDLINQSLVDIDFNPGRFVRLVVEATPNRDVRQFQADLRACTDDIVGGDEQYSEERFLRVKKILDRFKGREGSVDADKAWTERVTDVRQWFVFSASERFRDTDVEHENYTDSGGKSGGQKEKLAYTILAASLAYQFRLDWGAAKSNSFRFVVIDEAFGRGSESSTRYALELFTKLGLQMLIVTPLQKIHVIEPFVSAVGFVDNPEGNSSRLHTMTINEFRSERLSRP